MTLEEELGAPLASFVYEGRSLKALIGALAEAADEAVLRVTGEGVSLAALDPSRTLLLEVFLPSEALLDFQPPAGGGVEAGLNLGVLERAVGRARAGEQVRVALGSDRVLIAVDGVVVRRYLLRSLEVSLGLERSVDEVFEEIRGRHLFRARLDAQVLARALRDVGQRTGFLSVEGGEAEESGVYLALRSRGEGRGRAEAMFTPDLPVVSEMEYRGEGGESVEVEYERLAPALKAARQAVTAEVSLSSGEPLYLELAGADGGRVRALVAPQLA